MCNNWLIKCLSCFQPYFQLYHSVYWVSYQYYWSIYLDTSQSVVILTQQPWTPRRAAIITSFKVFGMTRPGIEPGCATNRCTCMSLLLAGQIMGWWRYICAIMSLFHEVVTLYNNVIAWVYYWQVKSWSGDPIYVISWVYYWWVKSWGGDVIYHVIISERLTTSHGNHFPLGNY